MAGFLSRMMSGLVGPRQPKVSPFAEVGRAGYQIYGGYLQNQEKRRKLVGQNRYKTATEQLRNISIIAAGLRYYLNLCAKPAWSAEPVDDTPAAQEAAEFVEMCMEDCRTSWARIVRRTGMFRFHGFAIEEWTAVKRADGKIGIDDIESRPQHTIERWEVDERGTVQGVWQRSPQDGAEIFLPRPKILYVVDDMMTDSPEGLGWWRQLVEPSERMEEYLRLEGIGYERDLSGIPVGKVPYAEINALIQAGKLSQSEAQSQIEAFENFVQIEAKQSNTGITIDSAVYQDVRDNGVASASTPKWGLELLTGESASAPHLSAAIERLTWEMARIIGVENLLTGSDGVGSQALSADKSRNLYLSINATLKDMAEAFDRDVVGAIWALNGFDDALKPCLKCEDVAFKDVEQVTAALRDMATAGAVLAPDDPAVDEIRLMLGLSPQPEMTPERMGLLGMGGAPGGAGRGGQTDVEEL